MFEVISFVSNLMLPAIVVFVPLYAVFRKVPVYDSFVEGAKEGFPTAISIIPHLVGMMVAVSIFRDTGALQFYLQFLKAGARLAEDPGRSGSDRDFAADFRNRFPGLCGKRSSHLRAGLLFGKAGIHDSGKHRHHFICADGLLWRRGDPQFPLCAESRFVGGLGGIFGRLDHLYIDFFARLSRERHFLRYRVL
jgi:hypothetical protein